MSNERKSFIDIEEVLIFFGLAGIGGGIGMLSIPIALLTVGSLVFLLGVLILVNRGR